ncbi:UDP-2,3-diacylglucosamine pyrophosphatase [Oleiphilus messinensis]|uniref:UDP-2,3-diacylglucosamine hydrolase n=1 Tax=Oleiphilus messinensis TaxID=141451 RepID=A0A1Y0I7X1_9GAMM|nr:UDP-2,3-diacylglucosamine diphosphatase [Oleiphilus messinensis]ARU56299.1 UDP-2,3-diacylglucosamine pyrophosphatase [Oleiphilus messinensis]
MSCTVFISDLHLEETRPEITDAFISFLEHKCHNADRLYILGDLFEAWIGDDEHTPLQNTIAEQLLALKNSGTTIYFQHGNRDFLLQQDYATRSGMELLPEEAVISLYGTPVLLMHGDSLCTRDTGYMHFRKTVRTPVSQAAFLARSLDERKLVAKQMRQLSQAQNSSKSNEIMDVTEAEVESVMTHHQAQYLIQGHTHRPKIHDLTILSQPAKRIVLGDWENSLWYLRWLENGEYQLLHEPIKL